jgi:hypothetical protein
MQAAPYPVQFSVDYPDRALSRASTAFRLILAIPIVVVLGLVSAGSWEWTNGDGRTTTLTVAGGGLLVVAPAVMILFRRSYPRWWFDWNREMQRFGNRVLVYLALMDDRYPSTTDHQSVRLEYEYPDAARELNQWLPLVKWLLAIPHVLVLAVLWLASAVVVVCAWFAILFTGHYPRAMFALVEGTLRWQNRVVAYALLMITDQYPPFRLSA